jgi:hypothetical protein
VTNHLSARISKVAAALLAASALNGCTHVYMVHAVSTGGRVGSFHVPAPVELVNAQDSTERRSIGDTNYDHFYGDMHGWTATMITVMAKELRERGMPASSSGAAKQLRVAITHAQMYFGFSNVRCVVNIRIETPEKTKEFEGEAASGWTPSKACDVAVARGVAEVLNDPAVLAYIAS